MKIDFKNILCVGFGTIEGEDSRWDRIRLLPFNVREARFRKTEGKHKLPQHIREYVQTLKSLDQFPAMLMESDATPSRWFKPDFEIPDDAGVVYLGLHNLGIIPFGGGVRPSNTFKVEPYSDDYAIARNMLNCVAMLFVTEASRDEFVAVIEAGDYNLPHDMTMALAQPSHQWLVKKQPLFFQNQDAQRASETHLEIVTESQKVN